MAITRDYQGVQIQSQDTRQIAAPEMERRQFQGNSTIEVGSNDDWANKLIVDLAGQAKPLLDDMASVELQNRYLEGSAKVGQIQSEADIQGNPFSRDWEVAGYRDATNRMIMADADAQLEVDMQKLREQPPEAMAQYLAARRQKLQPLLASGSREQRVANFAKLATGDQAALRKHAAEFQAHTREVEQKSLFTSWTTSQKTLEAARIKAELGGPEFKDSYNAQLANAASRISEDVWANNKLTRADKESLTMEMLENALKNGDGNVYDYLANNPQINVETGERDLVTSRLSIKNQNKLSEEFVKFKDKYVAKRNGALIANNAKLEVSMKGPAYNFTDEEYGQHANQMLSSGVWSKSDFDAGWTKHYTAKADKRDVDTTYQYALAGKSLSLRDLGKSDSDVVKALDTVHARERVPVKTRIGDFLQVGKSGLKLGYEQVGKLAGPMFMQMVDPKTGQVNAENAEVFSVVLENMRTMTPAQQAHLISGMTKEEADFFTRVQNANGATLEDSVARAGEQWQTEQKIGKEAVAAMGKDQVAADKAEIKSYDSIGLLKGFFNRVTPTWLGGQIGTAELSPREDMWESNRNVVDAMRDTLHTELWKEVSEYRKSNPTANSSLVMNKAAGNLVKRTVPTTYGPIHIPMGENPATFFGTRGADNSTMGEAISNILGKPKHGGRFKFETNSGVLVAIEYDNELNATANRITIGKGQVQEELDRMVGRKLEKEKLFTGEGETVRQGDAGVRYNGENTAGVRHDTMLKFRRNLVGSEGIRNTKYKDTLGNDTIGVGIVNKKYWPEVGPDGKVSDLEISRSFINASNDAAKAGTVVQRATGLTSDASLLLFSEMAYQGGIGWYYHNKEDERTRYRAFVDSIKTNSIEDALEKFKETAVYKASGESRRKHYAKLIEHVIQQKG